VRRLLGILVLAGLCSPGICHAATAKNYAYIFIQGRIADPYEKNPLSGATVRLTAGSQVFTAITDRKGVFVFDKLPVETFLLDIVTAEGKVVDWFQEADMSDPDRPRVKVKFAKKRGRSAVTVVAWQAEGKVELVVTAPPARWGRFWKGFAIFAAAAVVLSR
jgi:hypothetical protein